MLLIVPTPPGPVSTALPALRTVSVRPPATPPAPRIVAAGAGL